MDSHFRRRPSHGVIVAYLALFVALGGTSLAAKSALDGDTIKKRSIPGTRLERDSVGTKEVKGLLVKDFKAGQLPSGERGATGPQGPQGLTGAEGGPGVSGLERVAVSSGAQNSNSGKQATATCSAGKRVIGASAEIQGGVNGTEPTAVDDVVIDEVVPTPENVVPGSVTAQAIENKTTALNWAVTAYALCANVSP